MRPSAKRIRGTPVDFLGTTRRLNHEEQFVLIHSLGHLPGGRSREHTEVVPGKRRE
jgi:hypothetical protein